MSNRNEVMNADLTTWTDEQLTDAMTYNSEMKAWSTGEQLALNELWDTRNPFASDKAEQWLKQARDSRENMTKHWTQSVVRLQDELDRRAAKANLHAHIAHTLMAARNLLLERGYKVVAKELEHVLHEEGIECDMGWDDLPPSAEATAGAGL